MPVRYDKEVTMNRCCIYAGEAAMILHEGLMLAGAYPKRHRPHLSLLILTCQVKVKELRFHNLNLLIRSISLRSPVLDDNSDKLAAHCSQLRDTIRHRIVHLNAVAESLIPS